MNISRYLKTSFFPLNTLHIFNDGFQASYILLLPFIAKDLGLSLTKVGSLGTILNVTQIALAIPAGYLAARMGGLKTLILALIVYGAALVGVSGAPTFEVMLVLFALGGMGFALFHPIAFALIAKWSPKETRGRAMGNFTAIGDIGRIGISAVLTFIIAIIGWRNSVLIYALVALALALVFSRFLRTNGDPASENQRTATPMSLWQIIRNKRYVFALTASAFDSFASGSLFVFLPFLLLKRGVDPAFLGTFTATFFLGNFFGKAFLGRFVDRFGNWRVFIAAEALMAVFIFLLANVTSLLLLAVCSVVLGIFTKGTVPVLQTMVSDSVEHHGNFEKAFGIGGMVTGVAITLAPILLGYASDNLGIVSAFNIMAAVAVVAIIPSLLFRLVSPKPTS